MTVPHGVPSRPGPGSGDDVGLDRHVERQLATVWRRSAADAHLDRLADAVDLLRVPA